MWPLLIIALVPACMLAILALTSRLEAWLTGRR